MTKTRQQNLIKLQSKRNVELWIYSFADMYMILSVFFIALAVLYAAQVKKKSESVSTAGRGQSVITSSISVQFERGSAELTSSSIEELQLILPVMKNLKKGFVDIEGYSDSEPLAKDSPFSSNLDLSNRRAVKVSEWFIHQGVAAKRIRTFSYGDGHLFKVDGEKMPSNRRVLVKVASEGGAQ